MAIPASLITLLLGMALVLVGFWTGQNVNLLPLDASSNAPVYDALFQVLFIIGTMLFVGIVGLVVYSLIRFPPPTWGFRGWPSHRGKPAPGNPLDRDSGGRRSVRWDLQLRHL